jgi:hypothetical protein
MSLVWYQQQPPINYFPYIKQKKLVEAFVDMRIQKDDNKHHITNRKRVCQGKMTAGGW